jgi:hypothetical protein
VIVVPQTFQNHDARWWAARTTKWKRQALAHAALIRQLRKKLARHLASSTSSLRAYAGDCLAAIIDKEDPSWDPQRWNTAGSGAYGLPQALPGSKMASAGPDWQTNPRTQIDWMRSYARQRYGSECGALAWWNAHRSY